MQVLAHGGPNWHSKAIDVHSCTGQTAIGVGRSVMLYTVDGKCTGELRATGRGLVTSVSYGQDEGVSHLLVVSTSEGQVRLFDVEARRIVRHINEAAFREISDSIIFARLLRGAPHLVLIVFSTGGCSVLDVRGSRSKVVDSCTLPLETVRNVVDLAFFPRTVFIAGTHDSSGAVCSVCFDGCLKQRVIYSGAAIHDIAVEPLTSRDSQRNFRVAILFKGVPEPALFTASDASTLWTPICEHAIVDVKKQLSVLEKTTDDLYVCCSWLSSQDILVSDPRGTLTAWRVNLNGCVALLCQRPSAHVREVFAIVSHGQSRQCVTISTDRTAAAWRLTGCSRDAPELLLCWRTLRSNGPIRALTCTTVDDKTAIAYTSASGAVMGFTLNEGLVHVLGEAVPVGSVLGKRSQVAIDILLSIPTSTSKPQIALYHVTNGTAGVIFRKDGDLQFHFCKWAGKTSGKKRNRDWIGNVTGTGNSIWPVRGSFVSYDSSGALTAWFLSDKDGYDESKSRCKLDCLLISRQNVRVSAICPLGTGYIFGNEHGHIYSCTNGWCSPVRLHHTLGCVTCVAADDSTLDITIADCNGLLVTARLSEHVKLANKEKLQDVGTLSSSVIQLSVERTVIKMIWNLESAEIDHCYTSHNNTDSRHRKKLLATIHKNEEVIVWELQGSELIEQSHIKGHSGRVNDIAWVDSQHILTGGNDGTLRLWDVQRLPTVSVK